MSAASNGGSKTEKNAGRVSSQDAVRQIIRERGLRGLYTGFRLHFLRDTVGSGIYFGVYEAVKQSLNTAYGADKVNAPGAVAFAGAVCGIVAWGVVSKHQSRDLFMITNGV
jgi:solute carrier family 25 (mitochondrial carnitine/acylcarnitine transporter), member 20/29